MRPASWRIAKKREPDKLIRLNQRKLNKEHCVRSAVLFCLNKAPTTGFSVFLFPRLFAVNAGAVLGLAGICGRGARETPVGPFTGLGSNQTDTAVEASF